MADDHLTGGIDASAKAALTATQDILRVISDCRDDAGPVFDAILKNACELCNAPMAWITLLDDAGTHIIIPAWRGASDAFAEGLKDFRRPISETQLSAVEAMLDRKVVRIDDISDTDTYRQGDPARVSMVDVEGIRSIATVPLIRDGVGIGSILLYRKEVAPFTDEDITLVEGFAAQAVIAIENVRQFRDVQERLERETATKDILRVISQSRDDEAPVFSAILDSAARLCDADSGSLMLINEQRTHTVLKAVSGKQWGFEVDVNQWPLDLGHAQTEAARTGEVIHEIDLKDSDIYRAGDETRVMLVDEIGLRTALAVPLLQGDTPIGVIVLHRLDVARAFSDNDIRLVETFAAQAVIAIENVRQFREVQEKLERERASAEILEVISRSRDDERPVFKKIVRATAQLLDTPTVGLALGRAGDKFLTMGAQIGSPEDAVRLFESGGALMDPEQSILARAVLSGRTENLPDMGVSTEYQKGYPVTRWMVDRAGVRSALFIPLLSGGQGIGALILFRTEVVPFTDDQIALVETFAAQAVIAIENVRQFREVQERLERERASAEILDVISRSRDDDKPVFKAILERTAHLCQTDLATFNLVNEEGTHLEYAAHFGNTLHTYEVGVDRWSLDSTLQIAESVREGRIVHNVDLRETQLYKDGDKWRQQLADDEGVRSFLTVPLIAADGKPIGCIGIYRKEVRAFSDDEISMVETFAAQAVIAIENVRQFRELQERLEREAATGEVLGVISTSRNDESPVFDAIIENASRLCNAPIAFLSVANEERTEVLIPAHRGTRSEFGDILEDFREPITRTELVAVRPIATGETVLEDDIKDDDAYRNGDPRRLQMVDVEGARSVLAVPLIRGEQSVGAIVLYRREVAPFSADDLSLVQNFAAQAVIAIENVRQFREVQERLEREKATKEVLSVISQSRDDETPVFDKILTLAKELCEAAMTTLLLVNPDRTALTYVGAAGTEISNLERGFTIPLDDPMGVATAVRTGVVVNNPDLKNDDLYRQGHPVRVRLVDEEGVLSQLAVPLLQGDQTIGVLALNRREQKAFTADEVALIESFAAQAVIAIENVRQFKALETLNAELGDRVESQVGEIERMGRLKRFLPSAVADAVVTSGDESMLTSHRAMVATLFCDMRGFTAFCEAAEPEETIEVLQTYHQEMSDLIDEYGGGVDQRAGDGIMVIFNDPIPVDDPAGDAVRLAVAMREKMRELCAKWKRLGHRLGFGVGISLGYATVGMVGSAGRFDYTASGTSVNTAARLCDMAADGEVLISPRVWVAVEDDFQAESRGEVEMKGIREPVEVFAVE